MRKGLAAACLCVSLVSVIVAACSVAETRRADPTERRITTLPASVSFVEPEAAERVALTSRDRHVLRVEDSRWSSLPAVADDAVSLLDQLVTAERAVRDPGVTGAELAFMGHLQQLVYRQLIERPDIRDQVFSGIPADLRRAADLNIAACANLYLFGPVGWNEWPGWRIVAPTPMDDLLTYYKDAAAEFSVGWEYLAAINLVETRMGRIRGDSYAGAQGPMQFMPATWDAFGEGDINDARDAIRAAGRYLHRWGAPHDMQTAIWWYNHDPEYVDAVMKYAEVMRNDPRAFRGYYGWQVYFINADGTYLLPVGWAKD